MKKQILITVLLLVAGCKDATRAQFFSLGSKHKISVYSGGQCVKVYESSGNVSNETNSDGWYFEDAQTRKLVEIAGGPIVIEQE